MNTIEILEELYQDLKFELTIDMDPMVRAEVEKQMNDTASTIKYFRELGMEEPTEEFQVWKPLSF